MTLVVDASALVAIALQEPEGEAFQAILEAAGEAYMSPINIVEAGLVLVVRGRNFTPAQFQEWFAEQNLVEVPVSGADALSAYRTFGKGIHRAALNLGDCFAYALAKNLDAPLLYKGDDFGWTDVVPAYQPT